MIRRFIVVLSCLVMLTFIVACSNEKVESPKDAADNNSQEKIEIDYTQLEHVITEVLNDMPNFSIEKEISEQDFEKDIALSFSDSEKTLFRLKVESLLIGKVYSDKEMKMTAQQYIENNLQALTVAKEKYGVTVTQEEVTTYINDYIKDTIPAEKQQYAESLGITVEELDTVFDRDLYIMDTLWVKLTPVMMEKNSQQDGESSNNYMDRLRSELMSK